jgi:RimJ/RimL family protein N-acetyltransferase
VRTVAEAESYLATKLLPSYQQHGFGFYLVELKETRLAIGTCGLAKRETVDDIDVGYGLLERFAGNGYATEAASAVLVYAKTVLGLERVVGFTSPINTASIHVLQKLGLRYEKTINLPGYDSPSMVFA